MDEFKIDLQRGQKYAKRISHKPVRIFYFICSFFILIALIMPFAIGKDAYLASAGMGAFAGLLFFLVYSQTSAWSVIYFVGEDGIFLKRSWFKTQILFSEIEKIKIVSEEEAEKILYDIDDERVNAINSADITNAFKNQINFGKATMYSSVPIVGSETRGRSFRIRSHGIDTDGEFVFIFLKSGKSLALTPLDSKEFLDGIKFYAKGILKENLVEKELIIS